MNIKNVLVTIPVDEAQKARLEHILPDAEFVYYPSGSLLGETNPDLKAEHAEAADVILGNLPPAMLKKADRLKFLQLNSAGVEPYTGGALPEGAALANATGAYGLAISECMLTDVLMLKKRMLQYVDQQKKHIWECAGHVSSIADAVVLCVGIGNIGGDFLRKCKALGAYTIGVRRTVQEKPDWLDEMHLVEDLDELLPRADVVALVVPGTSKTAHMFDEERLGRLRSDAILVNVGRGNVLDLMALCRMLEEGRLAGAALDVTEPEPLPEDHPIWDAPNTIITPHVTGNFTLKQTLDTIVDIACENLRRFAAGEGLVNEVDFVEGYAKK